MKITRTWRAAAAVMGLACTAGALSGQPAQTRVRDILYRADGARFNGVVFIEWKSFYSGSFSTITSHSKTVQIVDGLLDVSLVPTTDATPVSYYLVRFNSDGRIQFQEYWGVPPSPTPLPLSQVRMGTPPIPGGQNQVRIGDIQGLSGELANRPSRGPKFENNRVVTANSAGLLETVSGNPSDCVRVDGSAAPCTPGGAGPGTTAQHIDAETPAGAVDGANLLFTLAQAPNPTQALLLYRNGMLQKQGYDYTLEGNVVRFAMAAAPQASDLITAYYRVGGNDGASVDGETPSGTANGVNLSFALANAPAPAASLLLFRNGLAQKQGIDYLVSGNTITFLVASVPQTGDILLAFYRKEGAQ